MAKKWSKKILITAMKVKSGKFNFGEK